MPLTNAQYDAVMYGYEEKRRRSRRQAEKRLAEVYAKLPAYRELDFAVSDAGTRFAGRLSSGKEDGVAAFKADLASISAQKRALLRRAGYPEDYLTPRYECPDCQDTGYIGNKKCHCFRQEIIRYLYRASNLEPLLQANCFSKLSEEYYKGEDLSRFRKAADACRDFIARFPEAFSNLFFYGDVGTGKSFLSVATAGELLNAGFSVLYFSAATLFDQLSENTFDFHNREALHDLYEDLYTCDLLVIDDLGTELTNQFVSSRFFACLNERFIRRRAAIISTNLSLEQLRERYSDRIFSRITSYFSFYKLTGPDIRYLLKTTGADGV